MININILPVHLRPIKRSPVPYLISIAFALLCALAMFALFTVNVGRQLSTSAQVSSLQQEYETYRAVVEESKRLDEQKKQLADKIATIDEIVRDRMIWSRQLWNLARLVPENIWYSSFIEDSKQFKEQKEEIDPKTKAKVKKEVTVSKPILRVSGYAIATPELPADISPLATAAAEDEEFRQMFSIETSSLKETLFENRPVKSFTLEFVIKPNTQSGGQGK